MCCFSNSRKSKKYYLIGGYIIQTDIPTELIRGNLSKYEVISESGKQIDLEVSIRIDSGIRNVKNLMGIDDNSGNQLKYYYDKEKVVFKNSYNKLVKYCELRKNDNNYKLEIVTDEIEPSTCTPESNIEICSDITYSLRDGVYIFLSLKGKMCLHSCGMIVNNDGILVIGSSGSGKSYYSKLLFSPDDDDYVGEDMNICSIESNHIVFTATPWCRKNNNRYAIAKKIILLETYTNKNYVTHDVYLMLCQSEFSFSWLPDSKERIRKYSEVILKNGYDVIFYDKDEGFFHKI